MSEAEFTDEFTEGHGFPDEEPEAQVAEPPKKRGPLTPKQAEFCRCVASGMTQSDAYRAAYDVKSSTKSSTVHQAAARLMADSRVCARVEALSRARDRSVVVGAIGDRERVLRKLRLWVSGEEKPTASQVRAAELLGKTQGMFRDVKEIRDDSRSSEDIASELAARLRGLVSTDVEVEVIDDSKSSEDRELLEYASVDPSASPDDDGESHPDDDVEGSSDEDGGARPADDGAEGCTFVPLSDPDESLEA